MSDAKELLLAPVEDAADDDQEAPEGVARHDNRTSTVTLVHPVEHARICYDEVRLRAMTAADLIQTDKARGDGERAVMMVAVIARIPMGAARRLDALDLERINDEIDFLKKA